MALNNELTSEQKELLIDDFKDWSGGFTPDECPPEEIVSFALNAMDSAFDHDAAFSYLVDYE
jgi:hypothetical protein